MFKKGELVWAKSAVGPRQIFWPAKIIDADNALIHGKRKPIIACVQFLVEDTCEAITDIQRLLPFHIEQKHRFLSKGQGLKDLHERLQFDSAVKQVEQQIKSSEEPSKTTYFEAAETTINRVGETSAFAAPKLLNYSKNSSAECESQKLCRASEGNDNSDVTRGTKRTCLFDSTKEGNEVESICKQGKKECKEKNENSPNKKRFSDLESSEQQIPFFVTKDDYSSAEQHESVVGQNCYEQRPDVCPLQSRQDTENFTGAQNKYGTTRLHINDVSQNISNHNCKDKAVDQDSDEEMFLSNDLHMNGVDKEDDEADTTKNNSISEEEDELPEAFSPSPGSESLDFHSEDVVWVKYRRLYWPAQIGRVMRKRNHIVYYVHFLPKQGCKCMKINKNNIIPFTQDLGTYEHYKNQEIKDTEQGEFEEALKQAEHILVRKAIKKDNVLFPENEDRSNDDSASTLSTEPCESNGTEEPAQRLKNETGETLTTPELRRSQRKVRPVSKYSEIMLEFHRCKSRLVKIFREKIPSERHRKFHYGTVAEKDTLKYHSGFGPIQNKENRKNIIKRLETWYKELQKPLFQSNYIFDVWIPEAIIFFIMNNESADREDAEIIYSDHASNVSKKEKEDVSLWFKNHKIDESEKQESLERAKRAFQRD